MGYESNGNEKAINPKDIDGFPRYGLLQYYLPTWQEWCIEKYGLPNDILNGEIQKQCFKLMLKDGQLWRWPPAKLCF